MELVITVCEVTLIIDAAVQNTHTHDICSPVFFLTENENLEIRPPQLSTPTNTNSPGSLRSRYCPFFMSCFSPCLSPPWVKVVQQRNRKTKC